MKNICMVLFHLSLLNENVQEKLSKLEREGIREATAC